MKHLVVAAALLVPALAAADPEHFVTIDRQDDSSRAGAELSYLFLNGNNSTTAMRFDVHGQYVSAMTGLGGYVSAPFGYISGGNQSDQALGDIEVGAIYALRMADPDKKLILHGGITLPTEKSSLNSAEIGAATFARGSRTSTRRSPKARRCDSASRRSSVRASCSHARTSASTRTSVTRSPLPRIRCCGSSSAPVSTSARPA